MSLGRELLSDDVTSELFRSPGGIDSGMLEVSTMTLVNGASMSRVLDIRSDEVGWNWTCFPALYATFGSA